MPIKVTRTLLTAALDGSLRNAKFRTDPYFGFSVPTSVPASSRICSIRSRPGRTRPSSTRPTPLGVSGHYFLGLTPPWRPTQTQTQYYLPVRQDWLDRRKEPILEPELPIVDPHHHLWDRPGWRYLLDDLLADTNSGHNIVATVFVQARSMHRAAAPRRCAPSARPSSSTASPP